MGSLIRTRFGHVHICKCSPHPQCLITSSLQSATKTGWRNHPGIEIGTETSAVFSTEREVEDRPGADKIYASFSESVLMSGFCQCSKTTYVFKHQRKKKWSKNYEIMRDINIIYTCIYTIYSIFRCVLSICAHLPLSSCCWADSCSHARNQLWWYQTRNGHKAVASI